MNCERIQQLYTDLYEDTLSPSVKQHANHHLATCSGCRADYERFSEAMRLLDMPFEEVEVPTSFRAEILAKVAAQPKRSRFPFLDGIREWWTAPQSSPLKLASAVFAAVAVMVLALGDHSKSGKDAGANTGIVAPSHVAVTYSGMFNALSTATEGDKTFHNFTIQLPSSEQNAFVTAYVLQNGGAISDDKVLDDPSSATLAWRENDPLSNTVKVNIPVAVVSSVPAGSSLAFLVQSKNLSGSETHKDVAFVPLDSSRQPVAIPSGSDVFSTLKAVAASQDLNIVLSDSAIKVLSQHPFASQAGIDGATQLSTILADQTTRLSIVQVDAATVAIVAK